MWASEQPAPPHQPRNPKVPFHERFLAALPWALRWFKWTYFHGRALLYPQRCWSHQPRRPAAGSGCLMPRCWVRGTVNSRAVYTNGSITRCSEREVAVLCHLARTFLKMSKESTLHAFDTELFVTEVEQLPAIWDSRSSSYRSKQENTYAWETLCKTFIENFFIFINSLVQQCKLMKFLLYAHYIYWPIAGAASGRATREQLLSEIAALSAAAMLNSARGKGA